MPGNTFGQLFKITTFGESHGKAVGVVIDGCPAGIEISKKEIQKELDKRKPGNSKYATKRKEEDKVDILSGIFEGRTLGAPIVLLVHNHNAKSKDYERIKDVYRPGHADFTYEAKYGIRDWRGGGRASARETVGRVAAGAVARKILMNDGIKITGYVVQVGEEKAGAVDESYAEANELRCPDKNAYDAFAGEIESARADGDSIGGVVELRAKGVLAGLGEPVFHKLSSDLAGALMSMPAVKGVEIGDGFACAEKRGSENNDELVKKKSDSKDNIIGTKTNHAGGIVGGISNGEDIVTRIAVKPTSSIAQKQDTIDNSGKATTIEVKGRHDPCIAPRAVPVGEAMMALVLVDHLLLDKASRV